MIPMPMRMHDRSQERLIRGVLMVSEIMFKIGVYRKNQGDLTQKKFCKMQDMPWDILQGLRDCNGRVCRNPDSRLGPRGWDRRSAIMTSGGNPVQMDTLCENKRGDTPATLWRSYIYPFFAGPVGRGESALCGSDEMGPYMISWFGLRRGGNCHLNRGRNEILR